MVLSSPTCDTVTVLPVHIVDISAVELSSDSWKKKAPDCKLFDFEMGI